MMRESSSVAEDRQRGSVIGIPIDALSWSGAQARLMGWARARESRSVCICNVHSVVTATQDPAFRTVIQEADMATPDGAPVAWTLRRKGFSAQERINGPDLMWRLCEQAAREGVSIGLYGATQPVLDKLGEILRQAFPALNIAYSVSPPFRALSAEEDAQVCADINRSGAGLLFVGLGCPKQEKWIAQHRGRVDAVMLGVGAAFDYHAGTLKRAPEWMRSSGLEWLHRVSTEPRRLWRRYLVTNSIFIATSVSEWFRGDFARR